MSLDLLESALSSSFLASCMVSGPLGSFTFLDAASGLSSSFAAEWSLTIIAAKFFTLVSCDLDYASWPSSTSAIPPSARCL